MQFISQSYTQKSQKSMAHSQSYQDSQLYNFKVIIVGEAGTGKTSIVSRISQNIFVQAYEPTINVAQYSRRFNTPAADFLLNIYDTPGEETYRPFSPAYFREASCVIFVFDLTRPQTLMAEANWLDILSKHWNEKFMLVVCGTKSDLPRNTDEAMVSKFKTYSYYYEVSALNGANIDRMIVEMYTERQKKEEQLQRERLDNQINRKMKETQQKSRALRESQNLLKKAWQEKLAFIQQMKNKKKKDGMGCQRQLQRNKVLFQLYQSSMRERCLIGSLQATTYDATPLVDLYQADKLKLRQSLSETYAQLNSYKQRCNDLENICSNIDRVSQKNFESVFNSMSKDFSRYMTKYIPNYVSSFVSDASEGTFYFLQALKDAKISFISHQSQIIQDDQELDL